MAFYQSDFRHLKDMSSPTPSHLLAIRLELAMYLYDPDDFNGGRYGTAN